MFASLLWQGLAIALLLSRVHCGCKYASTLPHDRHVGKQPQTVQKLASFYGFTWQA